MRLKTIFAYDNPNVIVTLKVGKDEKFSLRLRERVSFLGFNFFKTIKILKENAAGRRYTIELAHNKNNQESYRSYKTPAQIRKMADELYESYLEVRDLIDSI